MSIPKPKILKSKIVLNAFYQVQEDLLELPHNKEKLKYYTLKTKETISVLAITKDNKVVLNQEYRHPVGKILYDLPAGYIEKGEQPREAALRELEEETGFRAKNIKKLGSVYALSGVTNMVIHFFKAWHLQQTGKVKFDKGEFIKTKLMPVKELKNKIVNNEFKDMPLVACVLLALAKHEI